jgi:hypothetical protein
MFTLIDKKRTVETVEESTTSTIVKPSAHYSSLRRHSDQCQAPRTIESAKPDTQIKLFSYSPLLSADIRLLQILPCETDSSTPRLRLVHVPLFEPRTRRYTALSYTWDAGAATSTVLLNEQRISIRSKLVDILRRMRSLHYEFIWVCPSPESSYLEIP